MLGCTITLKTKSNFYLHLPMNPERLSDYVGESLTAYSVHFDEGDEEARGREEGVLTSEELTRWNDLAERLLQYDSETFKLIIAAVNDTCITPAVKAIDLCCDQVDRGEWYMYESYYAMGREYWDNVIGPELREQGVSSQTIDTIYDCTDFSQLADTFASRFDAVVSTASGVAVRKIP